MAGFFTYYFCPCHAQCLLELPIANSLLWNLSKFTSKYYLLPNTTTIADLSHIDDHELLEKFYSDHNNEWLGILLPRYTLLLLGVCMKYLKNEEDAKDSVQQIFLKVIHELHKYRVDYFKSWIYMVAKNHCLMQLRGKGRFDIEINERILTTPDNAAEKDDLIEKNNTLDNLEQALRHLSKEQQQCIILFYLEKQSYTYIAGKTGFSMMQVKSHIQNGKRNLKLLLGDKAQKSQHE